MGNSSSQPETGVSLEHDVLLTDYDIPPPPYENASLSVSDEESAIAPPKSAPPMVATPATTESPEPPEPSKASNPSGPKGSIIQTIKGSIINAAKTCGSALNKLNENKFIRPFVVTSIIVIRLLLAITWVITWVIGFPIYTVLYCLLVILLIVAEGIYPEGFEEEQGAPRRFESWVQGLPQPCDVCD